ncbi:hypothetical protein X777_14190 [Ooceraea biroi]|uniref:Uncharacterized protein n=1 Tax=Ooceraea biroi TaxID=2015173 RepID=A0A026VX57_OOCBI|nr:hypothetical protein X777_14190 [Ooceraea biroi]
MPFPCSAQKASSGLGTTRVMDIKIPDRPPADLHPSTSKHPHPLGVDFAVAAQAPDGVHYLRLLLVSCRTRALTCVRVSRCVASSDCPRGVWLVCLVAGWIWTVMVNRGSLCR